MVEGARCGGVEEEDGRLRCVRWLRFWAQVRVRRAHSVPRLCLQSARVAIHAPSRRGRRDVSRTRLRSARSALRCVTRASGTRRGLDSSARSAVWRQRAHTDRCERGARRHHPTIVAARSPRGHRCVAGRPCHQRASARAAADHAILISLYTSAIDIVKDQRDGSASALMALSSASTVSAIRPTRWPSRCQRHDLSCQVLA